MDVVTIVHAHIVKIEQNEDERRGVLGLAYLCRLRSKLGGFEDMGEGGVASFRAIRIDELDHFKLLPHFRTSIEKAIKLLPYVDSVTD